MNLTAIVLTLCTGLGSAACAAEAGLVTALAGKSFVTPDAQGRPVAVEIVRLDEDSVELRTAGAPLERIELGDGKSGKAFAPFAPTVVSQVRFTPNAWIVERAGLQTRYALNASGDLEAVRSGQVEDWMEPRYIVAFRADSDDLPAKLEARLAQIHAEAERYEGHHHSGGDHTH